MDKVAVTPAGHALIGALRESLEARADPLKAPPMQAYMKSAMLFYGVTAPEQRSVWREVFPAHPLQGFDEWSGTVLALWRSARFREERYAAISLTGYRAYADHQTMESLPMYEELIVTGAWWDYVDTLAANRLGVLLRKYRRPMSARMRRWSRSRDMWKRRSAILCQLKMKGDTDPALLYECIEESWSSGEFFLRKAIGWALREYAKTDPFEVLRYVTTNEVHLSGLSRREALKNVV